MRDAGGNVGERGLPLEKVLSGHKNDICRIYLRSDEIVEVHLLATYYNSERVSGVIDRIKELNNRQRLLVLVVTEPRSMVTFSFAPNIAEVDIAEVVIL